MNKELASSPSDWEKVFPELALPEAIINPYKNGTPFWALFRFGYRMAARGKEYNNPCIDKEYIDAFKAGYYECKSI